jgi:hypothetical protein
MTKTIAHVTSQFPLYTVQDESDNELYARVVKLPGQSTFTVEPPEDPERDHSWQFRRVLVTLNARNLARYLDWFEYSWPPSHIL